MLKQLIRPFTKFSYYLLAMLGGSLLLLLLFWSNAFTSLGEFVLALFWVLAIFLTQWLGNTYIGIKLDKKFPALDVPVKRGIYGVIGLIVYSVTAFTLVQTIMYMALGNSFPEDILGWILGQAKMVILISVVISFVFSSIGFFKNWKQSVLNAQKLETEMLRYKYESLQNQINPHFLFNSFNVLSELVLEDQKMAVKFIQKLSVLYRYVLESKEKQLVPLKEEVDFIQSFIFLLKTRFEDKLDINLAIENMEGQYVVPMALQLLVENAVKHNMATTAKVLKVDITKEGDVLIIKNNLQLKSSHEHSTKKGLENLHQQYSFFTDRKMIVENTGDKFIVKIPLLDSAQ